jgi:hypothetical protein
MCKEILREKYQDKLQEIPQGILQEIPQGTLQEITQGMLLEMPREIPQGIILQGILREKLHANPTHENNNQRMSYSNESKRKMSIPPAT